MAKDNVSKVYRILNKIEKNSKSNSHTMIS